MKTKIGTSPIITIIIPVYQAVKYLKDCLDSVIAQSFTDWEMLLIDDGSSDGSEIICDEYAARDNRIHVYHQKNAGQSAARNLGLDNAKGEYITMIDADDLLLSNCYLEELYRSIVDYDAKTSICNAKEFRWDEVPEAGDSIGEKNVVSGKDIFRGAYKIYGMQMSVPFIKMYHRSCFHNVRYPVGRRMEDVATMHQLLYPCERIVIIDAKMYGYRKNPEGTMGSSRKSTLFYDMLAANEDRKDYFQSVGDEEAYNYTCKEFRPVIINYYLNTLSDGSTDDIAEEDRPSPRDMHRDYYNKGRIHNFLLKYDPDIKKESTASFFRMEYESLSTVLRMAKSSACGGSSSIDAEKLPEEVLDDAIAIAKGHRLVGLICDYVQRVTEPGSEKHHYCKQKSENLLREFIIREKKGQSEAEDASRQKCLALHAVNEMLKKLYTKPWLRMSNDHELPDGIALRVGEKHRSFASDIAGKAERDGGVTENDCALYLLAVIDYCLSETQNADLNDLLDLHLLLGSNPDIEESDGFKKDNKSLELEETYKTYCELTEKLFSREEASYSKAEMVMMAALLR